MVRSVFEGKDLTHLGSKEMRDFREKMQIIFQDPYSSLNPRITIGEAIMEPNESSWCFLIMMLIVKARVMELLTRVRFTRTTLL